MPSAQLLAASSNPSVHRDDDPSALVVAYRRHLVRAIPSIWQMTSGILGQPPAPPPRDVNISACSVDGDEATLEVTAKIDDAPVCGRVTLRYYGGGWRVLSERYLGCTPLVQCLKI